MTVLWEATEKFRRSEIGVWELVELLPILELKRGDKQPKQLDPMRRPNRKRVR